MSGSLTRVARELTRCKVDLVIVQEVRWEKVDNVSLEDYIFFKEKETKVINLEQDFCTPQKSISS